MLSSGTPIFGNRHVCICVCACQNRIKTPLSQRNENISEPLEASYVQLSHPMFQLLGLTWWKSKPETPGFPQCPSTRPDPIPKVFSIIPPKLGLALDQPWTFHGFHQLIGLREKWQETPIEIMGKSGWFPVSMFISWQKIATPPCRMKIPEPIPGFDGSHIFRQSFSPVPTPQISPPQVTRGQLPVSTWLWNWSCW